MTKKIIFFVMTFVFVVFDVRAAENKRKKEVIKNRVDIEKLLVARNYLNNKQPSKFDETRQKYQQNNGIFVQYPQQNAIPVAEGTSGEGKK